MKREDLTCKEAQILLMGLIDGELPAEQEERIREHMGSCRSCREQHESFSQLKEDTLDMKMKPLPEVVWDEYWEQVYNKIERRTGWVFISIGLIVILSFAMYHFVMDFLLNGGQPMLLRAGVSILGIGMIIISVSVLRERLTIRKVDKYRSIKR